MMALKPWQGPHQPWVFAYGSLMWRPDFAYAEAHPARLGGWHRAMCVLSNIYRGTDDNPGLVLGLDRGGSCTGRAFRVEAEFWSQVREQLHERELVTGVYLPRFIPTRLDDGRKVPAYAFIVDRHHRQYWRGEVEAAATLIRQGIGRAGRSRDYLANTIAHMEQLGLKDSALHHLLRLVDGGE